MIYSDLDVFVFFGRVSFRSEDIFWDWGFNLCFFLGWVYFVDELADILLEDTLVDVVLLNNLLDFFVFDPVPFVVPVIASKVMSP